MTEVSFQVKIVLRFTNHSAARSYWRTLMRKTVCYAVFCLALCCGLSPSLSAQWVAFNDYAPGVGTHPNATTYGPATSGTLKNITNGAAVAASVSITTVSSVAGPIQALPNYGTPASIV